MRRSFVATFAFCLLGTLSFALGPALKLSRSAVIGDLKEQAGEDTQVRRWKFLPRNPLVVVQIAFSLALLTAAALFIRGAGKASSVDTGLQTSSNYLVETDASLAGYDQPRARELYRTIEERLASLSGVESEPPLGWMPVTTATPTIPISSPSARVPFSRSCGSTFRAISALKIGTEACTTAARPESMCCSPQAISQNGMAALRAPRIRKWRHAVRCLVSRRSQPKRQTT